MSQDPLALLVYAVMLLAGGMYPLGLLFGACSACCEEEEDCDRCIRAYDLCSAYESITLTYERGDSFVVTGINDSRDFQTYPPCTETQFFLLDQAVNFCGNILDVYLGFYFVAQVGYSPSGCVRPIFTPIVFEEFRGVTLAGTPFQFSCFNPSSHAVPNSCDVLSASFVRDTPTGCFANSPCRIPLQNYIDALGQLTMDLTLKSCDCGACCEVFAPFSQPNSNEVLCTNNVSENACGLPSGTDEATKYFTRLLSSEWQGVGVDCDPNPCEE